MGHPAKSAKTYQMEYLFKGFQMECPIIDMPEGGTGIWLSSVCLPYRRYPSHVYLFAALLCLIGYSMRKAAKAAGHLFGILKFSHSTISRCFTRMEHELSFLEEWVPFPYTEPFSEEELPPVNRPEHEKTIHPAGPGSVAQFIIPHHWENLRQSLCKHLYRIFLPILPVPGIGNHLLFLFWKRFHRMLL